jgi:hypothetical protein
LLYKTSQYGGMLFREEEEEEEEKRDWSPTT